MARTISPQPSGSWLCPSCTCKEELSSSSSSSSGSNSSNSRSSGSSGRGGSSTCSDSDASSVGNSNIANANADENDDLNRYCICGGGGNGLRMVACDCAAPPCLVEWYHFECVGLTKEVSVCFLHSVRTYFGIFHNYCLWYTIVSVVCAHSQRATGSAPPAGEKSSASPCSSLCSISTTTLQQQREWAQGGEAAPKADAVALQGKGKLLCTQ